MLNSGDAAVYAHVPVFVCDQEIITNQMKQYVVTLL